MLPSPPPEPPVNTSLDCLAPLFRSRIRAMFADLEKLGFDPIVAESCRSDDRQAWLYGMGRDYDDGRGVVTQAPTGVYSWHRYGLAVDVISKSRGWSAPASFWDALVKAAPMRGLVCGGSWPRFTDRPHVQLGPPLRQSPSSRAAELLAEGGVDAVWKEVGASL